MMQRSTVVSTTDGVKVLQDAEGVLLTALVADREIGVRLPFGRRVDRHRLEVPTDRAAEALAVVYQILRGRPPVDRYDGVDRFAPAFFPALGRA